MKIHVTEQWLKFCLHFALQIIFYSVSGLISHLSYPHPSYPDEYLSSKHAFPNPTSTHYRVMWALGMAQLRILAWSKSLDAPFNLLLLIKDAFVYIYHVISKNVALRSPPLDKNKKKKCAVIIWCPIFPYFVFLVQYSSIQSYTSLFFFFFFALPISQKKEHHPF